MITNPAPGLGQSCRSQRKGSPSDLENPVAGRVRVPSIAPLIVLKHPGSTFMYFLNKAEFAHLGPHLLQEGWVRA